MQSLSETLEHVKHPRQIGKRCWLIMLKSAWRVEVQQTMRLVVTQGRKAVHIPIISTYITDRVKARKVKSNK